MLVETQAKVMANQKAIETGQIQQSNKKTMKKSIIK